MTGSVSKVHYTRMERKTKYDYVLKSHGKPFLMNTRRQDGMFQMLSLQESAVTSLLQKEIVKYWSIQF